MERDHALELYDIETFNNRLGNLEFGYSRSTLFLHDCDSYSSMNGAWKP